MKHAIADTLTADIKAVLLVALTKDGCDQVLNDVVSALQTRVGVLRLLNWEHECSMEIEPFVTGRHGFMLSRDLGSISGDVSTFNLSVMTISEAVLRCRSLLSYRSKQFDLVIIEGAALCSVPYGIILGGLGRQCFAVGDTSRQRIFRSKNDANLSPLRLDLSFQDAGQAIDVSRQLRRRRHDLTIMHDTHDSLASFFKMTFAHQGAFAHSGFPQMRADSIIHYLKLRNTSRWAEHPASGSKFTPS